MARIPPCQALAGDKIRRGVTRDVRIFGVCVRIEILQPIQFA